MKSQDNHNIYNIYEEGVWDRFKAGAASFAGGLGGLKMLGGKGYAHGAQRSKRNSLMNSFIKKMKREIDEFEKFANNSKASKKFSDTGDILNKVKEITNILDIPQP
jgi:hypothetical protein